MNAHQAALKAGAAAQALECAIHAMATAHKETERALRLCDELGIDSSRKVEEINGISHNEPTGEWLARLRKTAVIAKYSAITELHTAERPTKPVAPQSRIGSLFSTIGDLLG